MKMRENPKKWRENLMKKVIRKSSEKANKKFSTKKTKQNEIY